MTKKFRSFIESRKYVRSLKLKNYKKWLEYTKSHKKPADIPSDPWLTYKKYWYGLGDWLGTGSIAPQKRKFRSFFEARKYARALGLKSSIKWNDYCKSKKIPRYIPISPSRTYKNKGWIGWGDWLGTGNIAPRKRKFRSFFEARKYARALGLKSFTKWRDYCKSKKIPNDIPTTPNRTYKNKGWIGWGDWLGTGNIAPYNRKFISFSRARIYARSLGLLTSTEWFDYARYGNKPNFIPVDPSQTYKKEWISWCDWFDTCKKNKRK